MAVAKRASRVKPKADRYTYRIAWSAANDEYVATILEFPSLSWVARSRSQALSGATSLVEEVLDDLLKQGEPVPKPWDERQFSGKFNLRLGTELHKQVALAAAENQLSMNTFVLRQLGAAVTQ